MIIEKSTIKTEAIFSEDRQYRYLLRKEWDNKKPKATIIMTNPSAADIIVIDYTTLYIINNLSKLDFGSVDIVNIIPKITVKLNIKEDTDVSDNVYDENIKYIQKSVEKSDKIIIAWGKIGENNKRIRIVQDDVLDQIQSYADKLFVIADSEGNDGFHPLAPQIRFEWVLKNIDSQPITTTSESENSETSDTETEGE